MGTTGTVVQQTEYYPSGTAYVEGTGAGVQPFKFTGKELILMHGLNWQDYGARWLDNVRMQWTTMDPLCEKYYAISPYTYCSDDPAKNIDPDGRSDGLVGSVLNGSLNAALDQYKGLEQLVTHPIQTVKAALNILDNISKKISQDGIAGTIIKGEAKIINTVNNNSANQNAYLAGYIATGAALLPLGGETKIAEIGSVASKVEKVSEVANAVVKEESQTVYRVFGGDARAAGFSWTFTNPNSVINFRDVAGLPSGGASGSTNTAAYMLEGKVNAVNIINSRKALPLDGNNGGLPEYIIDPKNVTITNFSVLKP